MTLEPDTAVTDKTCSYNTNSSKWGGVAEEQFEVDDSFFFSAEYKIIRKIAEGGMGAVYKALKTGACGFEKVVALKTMSTHLATHSKYTQMFIEEAKLVAKLDHENIVSLSQLGITDKDSYFFELEYVNGLSLYDFFHHHELVRKPVPLKLAVFIISRIARALAYAHGQYNPAANSHGVVHRDLCPRNILISREGVVKLTDFGIAVVREVSDGDALPGKAIFMSPEQANNYEVDFRSDIYSLGAVFFLLLAGDTSRKCYPDEKKILAGARTGNVEWDRLPGDVDQELKALLEKMLAIDPDDRYSNTDDLARELELYIYRDGYGPTNKSLSNYMNEEMPGLFLDNDFVPPNSGISDHVDGALDAKTTIF